MQVVVTGQHATEILSVILFSPQQLVGVLPNNQIAQLVEICDKKVKITFEEVT